MPRRYTALTFTDPVKQAQDDYGTRAVADRMAASEADDTELSWRETAFIQQRDSFYMASVGETGWPYVQFRGGPEGFLKVLGPTALAYADFRGNRQLISVGNLRGDGRVALILLNYPKRQRLKLLARATVHDAEVRPDLRAAVEDPDYPGVVKRVVVLELEAFDWNCPQHITPRFTEGEVQQREEALRARIRTLESQLSSPPEAE